MVMTRGPHSRSLPSTSGFFLEGGLSAVPFTTPLKHTTCEVSALQKRRRTHSLSYVEASSCFPLTPDDSDEGSSPTHEDLDELLLKSAVLRECYRLGPLVAKDDDRECRLLQWLAAQPVSAEMLQEIMLDRSLNFSSLARWAIAQTLIDRCKRTRREGYRSHQGFRSIDIPLSINSIQRALQVYANDVTFCERTSASLESFFMSDSSRAKLQVQSSSEDRSTLLHASLSAGCLLAAGSANNQAHKRTQVHRTMSDTDLKGLECVDGQSAQCDELDSSCDEKEELTMYCRSGCITTTPLPSPFTTTSKRQQQCLICWSSTIAFGLVSAATLVSLLWPRR